MPTWRLLLDVPNSYAIEPEYKKAVNSGDFVGSGAALTNTWHEPTTGLVMLDPEPVPENMSSQFKALDQFTHDVAQWEEAKRAVDLIGGQGSLITTTKPSTATTHVIPTLWDVAVLGIFEEMNASDALVWALTSTFSLAQDEPFLFHYHGMSDELLNMNHWFGLQWGNVWLHFSGQGICNAYQFGYNQDGSLDLSIVATHNEFRFAPPGSLTEAYGRLLFLPIPGYGLLVKHSYNQPANAVMDANGGSLSVNSHLVPFYTSTAGVLNSLIPSGRLAIALNPYQPHIVGYQSVIFPPSGSFTDAVFDPGYIPSMPPSDVEALTLPTQQSAASAVINSPDDTREWQIGDRQGRVEMSLTTSDPAHTPFCYGYGFTFPKKLQVRDTVAIEPRPLSLEFQVDDYLKTEGKANLLMQSAQELQIVARGDTTWQLDYTYDGITYYPVSGGLASVENAEMVLDNAGLWFNTTLAFNDNWARLREVHDLYDTAFDGVKVFDAINTVLGTAGEGPLLAYPPELDAIVLPQASSSTNQQWKLAPRAGDDGEKIIDNLLQLLRKQNVEYRMRYDWPHQGWVIEPKPRNTDPSAVWNLVPYSSAHDPAAQTLRYSSLNLAPKRPEANVVSVIAGASASYLQGGQTFKSAPLTNYASLNDPTSVDYLGRLIVAQFQAQGLASQDDVNKMARRIFSSIAYRRMTGTAKSPDFIFPLVPSTAVQIYQADGIQLFSAWIKKIRISVDQDDQEEISYELDDVWEGDIL